MAGAKADPQHHSLMSNVERARNWFRTHGPERGLPLELEARHDFQLFERTLQPTLPGPLPEDFAVWSGPLRATPARSGDADARTGLRRLPLIERC
jgi:anaerobic magnesium-protoporphyrin IX monomethyl ester cyclase